MVAPFDGAFLAVDRDARKIAHTLIRSRQLVEQRRLAAVLIAGKREREQGIIGKRVFIGA
jgi:hypothetical protein